MASLPLPPLPIDGHVAEVHEALRRRRAVVLSASPGAGKTTRIPPALIDAGPVILLQPRRLAARAVARRIAVERRWTIGREVGWQIRFERRFSRETRLLVVTEGILTARLQQDPLLSEFATIILDEFHERSIHADLGLALARQTWRAREDLRLVVMSATLDIEPVAAFLGDAAVIQVPGASHPLTIEHADGESVADAASGMLGRTAGQVLCFLPGAREIERARTELSGLAASKGVELVALHGSLDGDAQDAAIAAVERRRIVLATNIAETSLTVPGVTAVVDTGLVKVARYDAERGIDSLTLERVTNDSADQRAGRAARQGSGIVRRLWDARARLRTHREPEIARVDLAGPVLDVLAWGASPLSFEWFEPPSDDRVQAALRLLERLGAIDKEAHISTLGRQLQRIPLHPRLARILIDGRGATEVAMICAQLGSGVPGGAEVAQELRRIASGAIEGKVAAHISDEELRHAIFTGYADRLAKRRANARERFVLATGHGAVLARECDVGDAEYIVALDLVAAERDRISEARIRAASPVDAAWIQAASTEVEHRFDTTSGRVRASRVERYDAIVLNETPVPVDSAVAAQMLGDAWLALGHDEATTRLIRRLRFAGSNVDLAALAHAAAAAARTIDDIDIEAHLPFDVKRTLGERAPDSILVPSGRSTRLEYGDDGSVSASVKLQELFGLAASPIIGPARVPVTFHLLAPNGRPVQTTRDLRSFWERTYPEVRKELRGRYPKHPWPDDPWTAQPTHRTTRRR
ncbi:MAG TPA: ATP-dependent helicase C-terminal domain-containing protein [Vicinamibacterales bacterium]|nr:ATP-dependent helicase C-terminal domain-containing protein [Vicinamibacterales bacterium]